MECALSACAYVHKHLKASGTGKFRRPHYPAGTVPKMVIPVALGVLGGVVVGVFVGRWLGGGPPELRDVVTLASVMGTVGVALYGTYSNRQAEEARQAHELGLQDRRFVEERARNLRAEGVERFSQLTQSIRLVDPTRLIYFERFSHPEGISLEDRQTLTADAQRGWEASNDTLGRTDWFSMLGWSPAIREEADGLSVLLEELHDRWLDLFHDYVRPPLDPGGLDYRPYRDALYGAWSETEDSLKRLRTLIRET